MSIIVFFPKIMAFGSARDRAAQNPSESHSHRAHRLGAAWDRVSVSG